MKSLKKNSPFFLMLGASAALFLVNLIIKKYSNDEIYAFFAIFIIYSGYTASLSLLASEQVALRYIKIVDKKAIIAKEIIYLLLASSAFAAIIFFIIAKLLFKDINTYVIFLCIATFTSSSLTTIAFNYHRIQSNFNTSQLTLNIWKYLLPLLFFVHYWITGVISKEATSIILTIALIVSTLASAYTLYSNKTNIIIQANKSTSWTTLATSQLGFIASLSFLSMANSLDKVYITHFLSTKEFSDYFFTTLILMYPTLALSNYIGFKEFTKIKNGASYNLDKVLIKLATLGFAIFIFNICAIYLFRAHVPTLWNFDLIILLLILSSVRLPYSFLSAVMGAKATAGQMFFSNIICWLLSFLLIGVFFILEKSLFNALLCTVCVWIIRDLTYYFYARSNIGNGALNNGK